MVGMKPWKRVEPTKTEVISYRTIVTKTYEMPNGHTASFGTVWPEGQEFVAVIALTPDKQVIIARMFRVGPECVMDELPGGYVDTDETIEQAAVRELKEETGYSAGAIEYLGKSFKDAYMNAIWHTFLATDCVRKSSSAQTLETEEHIEVALIPIARLIKNATTGKMTDTVGVLLAYERLKEIAAHG